jgi:uncharacterized repeat protein (TIGR01451 family)
MPGAAPLLTIQTASLYASNDASTFTGTGGPFGFSPFTSQFGGTISSAGIASEAFNDAVYTVATGDEVEFVIAIQNMGAASAYGVRLQDVMPAGFVVPSEGIGLTVTDGLGNDLASSGNLFTGTGLTITPALSAYDPNSGQNVDLVTFSLAAGTALPGPYATLASTASIAGYSASAGGATLVGATPPSAATTVVTAAPTPVVTPETDPSAVAVGQTVSFDISVAIPAGTLDDVSIGTVLPTGSTGLSLVSASVISVGAALRAGTPVVGANGTIDFGTITNSPTSTGDNTIDARITVRATGTVSGDASMETVVSAAAPNLAGGVWTADVSSSVGVVAPPPPPVLGGLDCQASIVGDSFDPFNGLSIADGNPSQLGTLAISLQNGSLGYLSSANVTAVATGSVNPAGTTFYATGTLASLQAAARELQFNATATGTAQFTITVVDATGGVAQNSSTTSAIGKSDPLFDAAYYLAHNPDVAAAGVDPYYHYLTFGWKEGRDPSAYFDTNYYLKQNPDVAAANCDPMLHYEQYGWKEGREPSLVFSDAQYLSTYPDVAAANCDALAHYMAYGQYEGRMTFLTGGTAAAADPLINAAYYDQQLGATLIPTGTAAAQQAAANYETTGWQKNLNPDQFFNAAYYLAHNPDVAAAHVDPLLHYEEYGWKEGRNPSALFNTNAYLNANPDVKAAGVDPLLHYVDFGATEGRPIYAAPP